MNLILRGLRPELIALAVKHQIICKHEGIAWILVQGYRTTAEQWALFGKGRHMLPDGTWEVIDEAKLVTMATPSMTPHCRRAAYDIAILVNGKIDWTATATYKEAGGYGKEIGLGWGGDFKSMKHADLGHFELKNWKQLPIVNGEHNV